MRCLHESFSACVGLYYVSSNNLYRSHFFHFSHYLFLLFFPLGPYLFVFACVGLNGLYMVSIWSHVNKTHFDDLILIVAHSYRDLTTHSVFLRQAVVTHCVLFAADRTHWRTERRRIPGHREIKWSGWRRNWDRSTTLLLDRFKGNERVDAHYQSRSTHQLTGLASQLHDGDWRHAG